MLHNRYASEGQGVRPKNHPELGRSVVAPDTTELRRFRSTRLCVPYAWACEGSVYTGGRREHYGGGRVLDTGRLRGCLPRIYQHNCHVIDVLYRFPRLINCLALLFSRRNYKLRTTQHGRNYMKYNLIIGLTNTITRS